MLLQEGVSVSARSRLHVVVPVQVVQGGLGDVDAPVTQQRSRSAPGPSETDARPPRTRRRGDVPGLAAGLHLIGQGDVVGPDVELPLPEPEHPAVHPAAVDAHTHVHIHAGHLSYQSAQKQKYNELAHLGSCKLRIP